MKTPLLLVLLISLVILGSFSPQKSKPVDLKVETVLERYLAQNSVSGIAIGIIDSSDNIYCYGKSCSNKIITPESIFEIGSITKVFTSILLADEVLKGEMRLDDPVSMHLPDSLKNEVTNTITLKQLATHSSGLQRLADNFWSNVKDPKNPYLSYGTDQLYDYLKNPVLQNEPGVRYKYSNVGVGLLGHIISLREGADYEYLVKSKICEDAGLKNTTAGLNEAQKQCLATGFSNGSEVCNWDFQNATAGQGALRSNLKDMMAFMHYCLNPEGRKYSEAIKLTQHSFFKENDRQIEMGLGWHIGYSNDHKFLEHTGGTAGYRTYMAIVPGTQKGIVVLSNSDSDVNEIGKELLRFITRESVSSVKL